MPAMFTIGDREHQCVSITVLERLYPGLEYVSDRNFVGCVIDARSGGFEAHFRTEFMLGEFASFNVAVKRMYDSLSGRATLETLEPGVDLQVEFLPSGALTVEFSPKGSA